MNIAYLTSEYKDYRIKKGDTYTYISNSFCREWVKQGHNVLVIHNASCFPRIIYCIPQKCKDIFESKIGFTWGSYDAVRKDEYYDQEVHVYRLPIKKYIPHVSPSEKNLDNQAEMIKRIFKENQFTPDVIIGQWVSPQMELLYRLKRDFNCTTSVVLHGNGYVSSSNFLAKKYLDNIDKLGVRSKKQAEELQALLGLQTKPYVCYSGIPDNYIEKYTQDVEKFKRIDKWKFAFVGRLVEYKKADILIKALNTLKDIDWELNIIGEGAQLPELIELCKNLNCESRVIFHGKISRNQVMEVLSSCHCFAMVSEGEVFGLVYVEALGACCVTVASKGGGIDGVIKNRKNGYLVEAGNAEELGEALNEIVHLNYEELKRMVIYGYNTAVEFTESNAAKKFLNSVLNK